MFIVDSGIDMVFLKLGIEMASTAVYSLHKTSTREVSISCVFDILYRVYKEDECGTEFLHPILAIPCNINHPNLSRPNF